MVKHIIEYNVCVGDEVRFERMDGIFQYVSRGIQGGFKYIFLFVLLWVEFGLIVSDVFLLYLGYRYRIGKIWL